MLTDGHLFHRIVQLFEEIVTEFVQQENFTKLDFTQDQARIVAERVCLNIR